MKMLMVVCSEERQEDVSKLIHEHDVHAYTEITNVIGEGEKGKHLGTHTWPGKSVLVFTVLEEAKERELLEALKTFRAGLYEGEGIRVFALPVEVMF